MLNRAFFERDAAVVARALLGCVLVAPGPPVLRARIVETEAYVGPQDLASHSRHGPTRRNAAMFGPAGHAYVYLVYGMHYCLNVVCGHGDGQAVLLRAAEPLDGWTARLSGPGLLAKGFGVNRSHDRMDLLDEQDPIHLVAGDAPRRIATTARIGVGYAKHWARRRLRFMDANAPPAQPSRTKQAAVRAIKRSAAGQTP